MKQHILVVDDEAPIRELLGEFFKKRGYQVTTAATAEEASEWSDDARPDVVILDIDLQGVDGFEVLQTIKAAHPHLPVIMLTGMGFDDELLQEALHKGASGYVSKTLPLEQLLMEVHRTLNQARQLHPNA
ncbi:MAG: response regulator [Limisphaerales bacterium]